MRVTDAALPGGVAIMKWKLGLAATVLAVMTFAITPSKANIIYDVNISFGPEGGITGSITTDGHIGTLNIGNIVTFNLDLTANGSPPFDLMGPGTGQNANANLVGAGVTTTATTMTFDFTVSNSQLLFHNPAAGGSSTNIACFLSTGSGSMLGCNGGAGALSVKVGSDSVAVNESGINDFLIGTAESTSGAPAPIAGAGLPGMLAMLVGGLMWWRRKLTFSLMP
jgi:hypothetical protein